MVKRFFKYLLILVIGFLSITIILLFIPALWHRFVTYPLLEKQINEINELRKETSLIIPLTTYRGVMHTHSYWSHDSEGTLNDIIPAAKNAGIQFVFLTDHPRGDIDTIPRGYKGYYEGILIEPGSEKQGFDTWPLDSVIIDWNINKDTIAKEIVSRGGIIFYAHTEEPHDWGNPWYQGMEIYNFHADTKDESLIPQIINLLVNGRKYRHWAYRQMFDEQTRILALWDSLNTGRRIVGFSAVDAHENQNIRARYIADGRIEWVGPNANVIDTTELKFWNRWLVGEPDSNGWIFKLMIDTYETGFNHVTNYVLADTLTVLSIADHVKKGHLFTAFKSLGDASVFMYYGVDSNGTASGIMGDSINIENINTLNAISPLPGQFRMIHDGNPIDTSAADSYQYSCSDIQGTGAYRIEVHIKLRGKYVPWIYSNPIYLY